MLSRSIPPEKTSTSRNGLLPKKPRKTDGPQEWNNYKEQQRKLKLSKQGCERIVKLRGALDKQGMKERELIVSVDGSYTNEEVLKPINTPLKSI